MLSRALAVSRWLLAPSPFALRTTPGWLAALRSRAVQVTPAQRIAGTREAAPPLIIDDVAGVLVPHRVQPPPRQLLVGDPDGVVAGAAPDVVGVPVTDVADT